MSARPLIVAFACLLLPSSFAAEAPAKTESVVFETKKLDNGSALIATNSGAGVCTMTIDAVLKDAVCSKATPYTMTLKAGEAVTAFEIHPANRGRAWSFTYTFKYNIGDMLAKHDPETGYVLPYPAGSAFTVIQGFNGTFSHRGELEHAIDWAMPEGSTVCAARDGKVVEIKVDSNEGGRDRVKYFDKANFISIEHADGTVGQYYHLKQNGASVKLGQAVKAGEPIGLSGATGFTNRPHLHFHVRMPVDGKTFKTLPIKFKTGSGELTLLRVNESYTAGSDRNP